MGFEVRWGFPGDSMVKNSPANTGDGRDVGLPSLGQEDSPGGGELTCIYRCVHNGFL